LKSLYFLGNWIYWKFFDSLGVPGGANHRAQYSHESDIFWWILEKEYLVLDIVW